MMANFENVSADEDSRINVKNKHISVLVADDSPPMLEAVVKLLTPHYEIIGTASDGQAALEMIGRLKPEIAVLDISMPFKTGIEVAADLQAGESQVKIVIITAHGDEYYVREALSAGASAFVVKTRLGAELIRRWKARTPEKYSFRQMLI
jgi:DNA-binding NarL/FixJ family response regulator